LKPAKLAFRIGAATQSQPVARESAASAYIASLLSVKLVSRSQWNGGFGADFDPSGGDPWRRAFRPFETIAIRSATEGPDPKRALRIAGCTGGKREKVVFG
jgi:hypothetical protein